MVLLNTTAGLADNNNASLDPGSELKRSAETLDYYRREKDLQKPQPPAGNNVQDNTGPSPGTMPDNGMKILVAKIETSPSQILTAAEIEEITAPYEGREIGMGDLNQIIARINRLYKQKQYITARAVLPPQKITAGVVHIQLIEGRLGVISVKDNKNTRAAYILDRINLKSGDLVRLDQLDKAISYFNRTNDVQVRAELRPGKEFGTTDCVLQVGEPVNGQAVLFADNAGNDSTGLYREGVMIVVNSLLGNRDPLIVTGTTTRGTTAGSVSYNTPLNKRGTRLGVSYDHNQVDIISGALKTLDVLGHSSDTGLTLTHPLTVRDKYQLNARLEWHKKQSDNYFSGYRILDTSVKEVVAGVDIQARQGDGIWYIRNDFTRGDTDVLGADRRNFYKFNFSAIRQQALPGGRVYLFRLSGQVTGDRLLPSAEQFTLGGMASVRGYPEGFLSGDKGYFISAELQFPLTKTEKTHGLVFFDHGGSFAYKGNGQGVDHNDFLTSIGCGVMANLGQSVTAKLVLGVPVGRHGNYTQGGRVHFLLQSTL